MIYDIKYSAVRFNKKSIEIRWVVIQNWNTMRE